MKTDQEIAELRGKVVSEFFHFCNEIGEKYSVNEEFIAFTLLTCFGSFLGGNISKKDALRAFRMGFDLGERITRCTRK